MMRTTLSLPNTLHQRLALAAKHHQASLADYIRHLLDEALIAAEKDRLDTMYQDLADLDGIGPKDLTDVSTTIDQTLYGDHPTPQPTSK